MKRDLVWLLGVLVVAAVVFRRTGAPGPTDAPGPSEAPVCVTGRSLAVARSSSPAHVLPSTPDAAAKQARHRRVTVDGYAPGDVYPGGNPKRPLLLEMDQQHRVIAISGRRLTVDRNTFRRTPLTSLEKSLGPGRWVTACGKGDKPEVCEWKIGDVWVQAAVFGMPTDGGPEEGFEKRALLFFVSSRPLSQPSL